MAKTFSLYVTESESFADIIVKNLSGNFADKGKFFVADYGGFREKKMHTVYISFEGIVYAEDFVSMGMMIMLLLREGVPHVRTA